MWSSLGVRNPGDAAVATLTTISGPASEPVTLSQALGHLKIDTSHHDETVERFIGYAREWLEQQTGRRFITQTTELTLDRWPLSPHLSLRTAPVQSVDSVKYDDTHDIERTLAASEYWADLASRPARLTIKNAWPSLQPGKPSAVRIRMTTGAATPNDVPKPIKQALMLLLTHWFMHREPYTDMDFNEAPQGVRSIVSAYRLRY